MLFGIRAVCRTTKHPNKQDQPPSSTQGESIMTDEVIRQKLIEERRELHKRPEEG